jgi:hypothetical protein
LVQNCPSMPEPVQLHSAPPFVAYKQLCLPHAGSNKKKHMDSYSTIDVSNKYAKNILKTPRG